MKLLIVYFQENDSNIRSTIDEHLYSFERYSGEECYYLNVAFGVPEDICKVRFDIVIYHYTFCVLRNFRCRFEKQLVKWQKLRNISGYKVAIPQDEYLNTDLLCKFFREYSIKTVFTCLPETEWEKVYPKELSGLDHYVTVLTGYVDEQALELISEFAEDERKIDIGYRARRLPYYLGSHGCLKWQIADKFKETCSQHSLKLDISTDSENGVYFGKEWYKFLCRCRTVIGCEGGASLLDHDGSIRECVDSFVRYHPDAGYEEVEKACFPGLDGNLQLFAISPRHFECCMTKTCQVLLEGHYAGILKPGIHYIEVKKDWRNLEDVIRQISDHDFCRRIAENAYRDIVASGMFTYKNFVRSVVEHSSRHVPATSSDLAEPSALQQPKLSKIKSLGYRGLYRFKFLIHNTLKFMGLFERYVQMREYGLKKYVVHVLSHLWCKMVQTAKSLISGY